MGCLASRIDKDSEEVNEDPLELLFPRVTAEEIRLFIGPPFPLNERLLLITTSKPEYKTYLWDTLDEKEKVESEPYDRMIMKEWTIQKFDRSPEGDWITWDRRDYRGNSFFCHPKS